MKMFTYIWKMWLAFLKYVSKEYKHYVLDAAHPAPKRIVVYPGCSGSVQNAILTEVLCFLDTTDIVVELDASKDAAHSPSSSSDGDASQTTDVTPSISLVHFEDDDEESTIVGLMTVVRLLGRYWREYPTHPINSAKMDSAMELLSDFLSDAAIHNGDVERVRYFFTKLCDEHLKNDKEKYEYMGGFERKTLADVCWGAALRWIVLRHPYILDDIIMGTNEFEALSFWWVIVPTIEASEDSKEAEYSTDENEDDQVGLTQIED